MKRTAAVLFLFAIAGTVAAEDQRLVKRDGVRELLKIMDGKALTQTMFNMIFIGAQACGADERVRDRLFAAIDYATWTEDVYAPVLDKTFTAAEIEQLRAFFKTSTGQKVVNLFPDLAWATVNNAGQLAGIVEAMKDDDPAEPWQQTMIDLRTVATATEAYATDTNKYPSVSSYEELGPILSPTYIKTLPGKDAWGTAFVYVASGDGQHYRFVSAGADKRFDSDSYRIETLQEKFEGRAMDSLDDDIIFQDGAFVQYPALVKKEVR
ncbi:MAG TPA: DUF2059 domain-containing protein [Thermoanaerobaculia bacterium]